MSGLEELRKKLSPLFDAEKGFSSTSTLDTNDSYTVSVFSQFSSQPKKFVVYY
jgi:hypothetical protein